jgi:hypothetical protein
MKITVNGKEYTIKFGYKATIKSKILGKLALLDHIGEDMESINKALETYSEIVLVGLQKFHSDEFGYDLDTDEGKTEKLDKAYDFIENYLESEEGDIRTLYAGLEQELINNSFLSKMFQQEQAKAQKTAKKATATK